MGEQANFHEGEQEIQARYGLVERVEKMGQRVIRPFMPDQHREFYESLPMIFVGSLDAEGRPWASVLWGAPGFVRSPHDRRLEITTKPEAADPLAANLREQGLLGMLGLELETRRRNRVNGRLAAIGETHFSMEVTQSFGNCPKYIQVRWMEPREVPLKPKVSEGWSQRVEEIIAKADTFFIASAHTKVTGTNIQPEAFGVDMSHRGGLPGFITIEQEKVMVFPDYRGNNMYNTLGNFASNPVGGYLFMDFESGDILQMTGRTEILWEPPKGMTFPDGVDKMVRFEAETIILRSNALPFRFSPPQFGPGL